MTASLRSGTRSARGITARVEAGAAWLDKHKPGWVQQIDLDRLDLVDECNCVLGQMVGRVDEQYDYSHLVIDDGDETKAGRRDHAPRGFKRMLLTDSEAGHLGFHLGASGDRRTEWTSLTDAWRRLIKRRLAEGPSAEQSA